MWEVKRIRITLKVSMRLHNFLFAQYIYFFCKSYATFICAFTSFVLSSTLISLLKNSCHLFPDTVPISSFPSFISDSVRGLWNFFMQLRACVRAAIWRALLSCVLLALLPGDMIWFWSRSWVSRAPVGVVAAFPVLLALWSRVWVRVPDFVDSLLFSGITFSLLEALRSLLLFFFPWRCLLVEPPWEGEADVLWDCWHSALKVFCGEEGWILAN